MQLAVEVAGQLLLVRAEVQVAQQTAPRRAFDNSGQSNSGRREGVKLITSGPDGARYQ